MRDLTYLATRILGCPLMAEPRALARVLGVLSPRLGIEAISLEGEDASPMMLARDAQDMIRATREYRVQDGVAVIPVIGSLVSRSTRLQPSSGMTGYTAIGAALDQAVADADVRAVMLEIDSPGGEAAGVMDLARRVREAASVKPVWAMAADLAASAAYAIASGAQRITVPSTGFLGSIGTVYAHVDRSGELAQKGWKVTIIKAGDRKADGNQLQPLSDEAAARIEADVNALNDQFIALVAAHRGMSEAAVRAQQADVFLGQKSLKQSLADAVMAPREALAELKQLVNSGPRGRASTESRAMPEQTGAAPTASFSQADMDAAVASAEARGRETERARIAAILGHDEAEGRAKQARHLALKSAMSAEDAGAFLATCLKEEAAKPTSDFARAMDQIGNPRVGADGDAPANDADAIAQRILGRKG